MSSAPKSPGRAPGPPPERKAPGGVAVTPQVLGVIIFVILVIGAIVYSQMVVVKFTKELERIEGEISQTDTLIGTYTLKKNMKEKAANVNQVLREKLRTVGYLFLEDQMSIIPFWEDTFTTLISTGYLEFIPGTSEIDADEFEFAINQAMTPFDTLPGAGYFGDDVVDFFPIEYRGEKNGNADVEPVNTRPTQFLTPYNFKLIKWGGTYEDVKKFIEDVQKVKEDRLITIHCLKNDEDEIGGFFRRSTQWTIAFTVYFMNPEQRASGDTPPKPPGANSC